MGNETQAQIEQAIREMRRIIASAERYGNSGTLVVVDRRELSDYLLAVSNGIYALLDEYELTEAGKDRARRDMEREQEEFIKAAKSEAGDITASSLMYVDHTLDGIISSIEQSREKIEQIYATFQNELTREEENVRSNKLELKGRLQTLDDTKIYSQAIEDARKRIAQELGGIEELPDVVYEKPEIIVNEAYIPKTGDEPEPLPGEEMGADLDALHFGTGEEEPQTEEEESKGIKKLLGRKGRDKK